MWKYKNFILLTISLLIIDRYMLPTDSNHRKHLWKYIAMRSLKSHSYTHKHIHTYKTRAYIYIYIHIYIYIVRVKEGNKL